MKKINIKGLSKSELSDFIYDLREKEYRAKQIWSWIYKKGVNDFNEMTDISKELRNRLNETAFISSLKLSDESSSIDTDTRKFIWELKDGLFVESVYIPEGKRRTTCISTQVGCAMGCKFCATGKMGFFRNLEPDEIIDQVLRIREITGKQPTNIVVMGMGEPLLNYDNLMKALSIIRDNEGIAIGHRKITISTAGIVPQIRRYLQNKEPYNLAISLNAATDKVRSQIMPVNNKYPIDMLIEAVKEYSTFHRKRITFEYVLLKDVNDTRDQANALKKLLRNIPCKINLIPYNETTKIFRRPDDRRIMEFTESLRTMHAAVTLRLSKGDDIQGACGQLAVKNSKNYAGRTTSDR